MTRLPGTSSTAPGTSPLRAITVAAVAAIVAIESARLLAAPSGDGVVAAAILFAALMSSVAGFAFAALAGSALAHLRLDPVQAVMTMSQCSIAIQSYAVWELRRSIHWRPLAPTVLAGALATPIGVALLMHVAPTSHSMVLGAIVIGYAVHALWRPDGRIARASAWRDAMVGAVGGVVGGLSSAPGLAMTIWCAWRGGDKVQQRALYQPYILAMRLVTVACLTSRERLQLDAWRDASFIPFALLGATGGFALYRRLTTRQFQWAVSLLLMVSGIGLLAREV